MRFLLSLQVKLQETNERVRKLDDIKIIDLYWERSESAIDETALKYGNYCTKIAMNILQNREDSEECVSDTYLKAWDAIPPQRPAIVIVLRA